MSSAKPHLPGDEELLSRIRKGDQKAFRVLFDRYYRELLGTAINLLKNEDRGKDVVQDVLLQIWKNRAKLEIRTSMGAYLKRSVINRSLNQIKYQKAFVDEEILHEKPQSASDSPVEQMAYQELEVALKAALDSLPERCRLVFVMKRLEGMSHKEISDTLGISPKTIENQMTKALKALRKALQRYRQKK